MFLWPTLALYTPFKIYMEVVNNQYGLYMDHFRWLFFRVNDKLLGKTVEYMFYP
jgi:hypothetical protein